MANYNNRSNFLIGLTLTELAFILFFILLFFSTVIIKKKVENIDKFKEEVEVYNKIFVEKPEFNKKNNRGEGRMVKRAR